MSVTADAPTFQALPASWYSDETQNREEVARIIRRGWHIAGLAAEVAEPGSFMTTEIGGVPIVVTRDRAGELHALINVCPHRGMVLASGSGSAKLLQCPNHAWVFTLGGELRSAPRSENEPAFCREKLHLRRAGLQTWGPFVLVNIDEHAAPPRAELDAMRRSVEQYGLDFDALVPYGEPTDWVVEANWKIVIENYLECYHCPLVHQDFSKVFDVTENRFPLEGDDLLLSAEIPVRDREQSVLDTTGAVGGSHFHLLFPTMTINIYPGAGALEATWYWPIDANRTGMRTVVTLPPDAPEGYGEQINDLAVQVGDEDNGLCESMHRGLASGMLERPTLLPGHEGLLVRFQSLVRDWLSSPA